MTEVTGKKCYERQQSSRLRIGNDYVCSKCEEEGIERVNLRYETECEVELRMMDQV